MQKKAEKIVILTIAITFSIIFGNNKVQASIPGEIQNYKVIFDTIWVYFNSVLVFGMSWGFCLLETGFCREKNAVNLLFKNLLVLPIAVICFFTIGFAIAYGDGNLIIGLSGFFLKGFDNSPATFDDYQGVYSALAWAGIPLTAKFFFQAAFAATATTIVSGAVAERIKLASFLCFSVILSSFIYPVVVHWTWGGGWLAQLGFYDFAGSSIVHSVGGWGALTGVIFLGERIEKYRYGFPVPLPGHNLSMATSGCFILLLGWFGFNCGSTLGFNHHQIHIAVTTILAASSGALVAVILSWSRFGKPDITLLINGVLAGLVAITASANCVDYSSAIVIGSIAGFLVVISILKLDRLRIDDPVGAISVHLVNGIWGTLAVAFFANPIGDRGEEIKHLGIFFGGGTNQLLVQVVGIIAIAFTTVSLTSIAWKLIDLVLGLRVSKASEIQGLNSSEHGMDAYSKSVTPKSVTPKSVPVFKSNKTTKFPRRKTL